jgi:hypothetical protein
MTLDPERAARVVAAVTAQHFDFKFWGVVAVCLALPAVDHLPELFRRLLRYLQRRGFGDSASKDPMA